jgi:dihydroxyacetone kinase-like protein
MPQYFAESPDSLVGDALTGFARVHADLVKYVADPGYLLARNPNPQRRVGLVSGGGSGPLFGLLSTNSPSPSP